MIKLVAMDIDGTLLDSNKNLSEENKKTVKEYEERDVYKRQGQYELYERF